MPTALVINGGNHAFDKSAPLIHEALQRQGIDSSITDDKAVLASSDLAGYDVLVLGSGFTRRQPQADGSSRLVKDLTPEQERGVFEFVRSGKGFVGIHGTGWWVGGDVVNLLGGHANWHPPGLEFTVQIDDTAHPVTQGIDNFTVQDEIYMSAWDPAIHVLASATWSDKQHPMAWTHQYGDGRVFYTTLGHGPSTFENPTMQRLLANAVRWAANGQ